MADDAEKLPLPDIGHRPVFLIGVNERLSFTVGETIFYYRRLPPSTRVQLYRQHSDRGLLDTLSTIGLMVDVARYCLRGWENLIDAEGKPVPFLEEVIEYLPLEVLNRLNTLAMQESPDQLMERYQSFLVSGSPSSGLAVNPSPAGAVVPS